MGIQTDKIKNVPEQTVEEVKAVDRVQTTDKAQTTGAVRSVDVAKGSDRKFTLNGIGLLSGAQLKYIAFLSMLIDHVNKTLIYPYLNGGALNVLSDIFDVLGRIAFPIFIFLLVEGYFHTRNKWKYFGTLIVFGVISEVPFDMFSSGVFFEWDANNIMFTLALVLVMIWIIDVLRKKMEKLPKVVWFIATIPIVAVMCFISMNLAVDYEFHAILIGYFLYIFHEKLVIAVPLCFVAMYKEPWALLGFGLTLTYNGKRGRQNKVVNYMFYPVHMLILGIIRMYLGL